MSTLALAEPHPPEGVLGRPGGRGLEDEDERNNDTDSVSAYEDASAETPDLDPRGYLGPGGEDDDDDDDDDELDGGEEGRGGGTDPRDPKDQDPENSCVLS